MTCGGRDSKVTHKCWSRGSAEQIWVEFVFFGLAILRKIVGEFLSEFLERFFFPRAFQFYFSRVSAPPPKKLHIQNCGHSFPNVFKPRNLSPIFCLWGRSTIKWLKWAKCHCLVTLGRPRKATFEPLFRYFTSFWGFGPSGWRGISQGLLSAIYKRERERERVQQSTVCVGHTRRGSYSPKGVFLPSVS